MKRVGFTFKINPAHMEEYKAFHRAVWPEMLDALRRTGWHNYTLFIRPDGMIFGYFETPVSLQAAQEGMAKEEINERWQATMKPYFEGLGDLRPDKGMVEWEEYFTWTDIMSLSGHGPSTDSGPVEEFMGRCRIDSWQGGLEVNSRERVLTALRRSGVPDRVPVQFDLCRSLLEAAGTKYGIPVHYTTSYYEDVTYRLSGNEIRTHMGSDCVVVGASLPAGYSHPKMADGCVVNEFGMKMRQGSLYMEVVECPLAGVTSVEEVRNFPFPDPLAVGRFDDARHYIEKYRGQYFIIGDLELTIFEMAWHLVGLEKFMVDLANRQPYVDALLDKVKEWTIAVGKKLVSLGVDGIWTGDDFGAQNGMMISPRMWRNVFKPRFAEIFSELKAVNPDVLMMYHSDGAVAPILGDLIEIGMDVFNPVQPNVPGHDPATLKAQWGERVSFWGAIDQQDLLPNGTPERIRADVTEKVRILGAGGGYMCAPAHIVQADTSLENVEIYIAAANAAAKEM